MIRRTVRVRRWVLISFRSLLASVWLAFGLLAKILGLVSRHRSIVARIVGEDCAAILTPVIGVLEVLLALWILSGFGKRACAAAQTLAILCMNTCEILWARDLLLAPIPMVMLNLLFLATAWFVALSKADSPAPGETPARRG